jgi:heterodisulfide reductase subunit B
MKFSYYPGCSLHATAVEYGQSVQAAFEALDAPLVEIPDWNCCGASSAHNLNYMLSLCLPARNMAIAQEQGWALVVPCVGCLSRLKIADSVLRDDPARRRDIEDIVGFSYSGDLRILPPLEIVCNDVGLERVRERVQKPLEGLTVACYYGCLLVRPPEIAQFDDPEYPQSMDRLMEALGAKPVEWSWSTECCGGALSLTRRDIVEHLVTRLVDKAREAGAQMMVTACPLCQVNLEMRQSAEGEGFPILYFTELMGLAFGLEGAGKWLGKHLVSPLPLLQSLSLA